MVFSSLTFLCVFFPAVFLIYQVLPGMRSKNALLIVASLVFYAYGEPVYVVLMLASTIVNWALGLVLGRTESSAARRIFLAVAVVANLGCLCVFKYADMVVNTFNGITGLNVASPDIALPIGISFYTFQALSYVIDVYRGEVEGQKNYAHVLLYIAFFPQLIAGPIIKYHDIEDQLATRHASLEDKALGFRRFCFGLGKKVLIANTMAVAVDSIFGADPSQINILGAWIAAIAYLMQIYFDFSGYSDMAIGMARMFGFTFKENFRYPYASCTIKEFWRRWHISLSTWFKEYVYIPLGGNRKGRPRAVFNKLVVFFTCGLWHGASWTFVVWGLIHGLFLLLEEYIPIKKLPKPIGLLYTLLVVCTAFVLFRADGFGQGIAIIGQMYTGFHFDYASMELAVRQLTPVFVIALVFAIAAAAPIKPWFEARFDAARPAVRIASYAVGIVLLIACVASLSGGGYNPFIYFRF